MQHVLAIINPCSGAHRGVQTAQWLTEISARRGAQLTIRHTVAAHSAMELVNDVAAYTRIVVSGGDGTVTEVMNGLVGANVPLAIIPGGTGNVLGQAIGVASDLRQACEDALSECEMVPMDLGLLNDQYYFGLRLSVGYEALITRDTTREKKARYGKLAYLMEGIRHALHLHTTRYRIDVDGTVLRQRAESVWVANTSALGVLGLQLDTAISPHDRQLDLVTFRFSTRRDIKRVFQALFRRERLPQQLITHIPVHQYVNIDASSRQPVQVDGDTVDTTPCRIQVIPAAILVCRTTKPRTSSLFNIH